MNESQSVGSSGSCRVDESIIRCRFYGSRTHNTKCQSAANFYMSPYFDNVNINHIPSIHSLMLISIRCEVIQQIYISSTQPIVFLFTEFSAVVSCFLYLGSIDRSIRTTFQMFIIQCCVLRRTCQ